MQGSPGTHRDLPFRTVPLRPPRACDRRERGARRRRHRRQGTTGSLGRCRMIVSGRVPGRHWLAGTRGNPMAPDPCQNVRRVVSARPLCARRCRPRHGIAAIQARLPERSMAHRDHHVGPEQHLPRVAYARPRPTAGGTCCDHRCPASLGKSAGRVPARLNSSFPEIQLQDERGFHRGCQ